MARDLETTKAEHTVLIVDDDTSVVSSLGRQLMRHVNTLFATSVQDAKSLLMSGQNIDVIATALRMHGGDGLNLLRHARRHHPKVRRVLFTEFVDPLKIHEVARDVAVTTMMFKPLDPEELLAYTTVTHPALKGGEVDQHNVWR